MKLNRKWLLVIALVLSLTMAISGTLAYLTDRDSAANVMTFGNVEIELNEDFSQGSQLIPGVDVEKKPTITNTGKNAAWVWATIAIPAALDEVDNASANIVHFNMSKESIADGLWKWTNDSGYMVTPNVKIDESNVLYNIYTVLYQTALQPGETTKEPVIYNVYLDPHVDIDPDGLICHVENGVVTKTDWNINTDGTPTMYVSAYAIQTESFENVEAAYAAYNAQWGDQGTEYGSNLSGSNNTEAGGLDLTQNTTTVNEPLYQNTTANAPYTINGNGNTVTSVISDASQFTWNENGTLPDQSIVFSSENGAKVTVNDLTIEGTISAVMAGNYVDSNSNWFNTELNNVNIVNAEVVSFSSNVSPALAVYGTATLNNCNIYGTTLSDLDTDPRWPAYDVVPVNYSDLTINNSKIGSIYMWNQAKVTVAAGTTVEDIIVRGNMNTTKYGLTIKDGATVNAIDLSNITNKAKVNITIEEGAIVGAIVANGTSYDSVAAWQAAQ